MPTLRLLGNASLHAENASISGRAAQPRRLALLALLALAPRKTLTREKLLAMLWPESDTEQGRHLLSVAVYELRKALGESAIVTARDDVALSEDLTVDVDEFERAIAAADYNRATELYAGPLLDGFHINDAPDFERWVDAERTLLARRYAEALEKLAQERESAGDVEGALLAWRKLNAHDPYSARFVCGLMLALEAAGARADALQQARAHALLLKEEFGAEPDPDVEALATRLRTTPREPSRPAAAARVTMESRSEAVPRRRYNSAIVLGIAILLAGAAAIWYTQQSKARPSHTTTPTIAVLPFTNMNKTDTASIFSDGLTDEIINALSKTPSLRVASRSSAFVFRGPVDVREVARKLGVDHVLEGTVRMAGNRIRVTSRLISAADGLEVWTDSYDGPASMTDLISIQEEIAQAVVMALSERFDRDHQRNRLVGSSTQDIEAFELFVTGRHYYHRRTVRDLQLALDFFDKALTRDPNYALAHASRAEVYALLGAYDYGALPPKVAFKAARASAERALQIDPNLAEAHTALASVLFNFDWDWPAAEREFRLAIQLSPGYANAHHWYSLMLQCAGRGGEALQEIMRARELDPLSPVISTGLARHYYLSRDIERAVTSYRTVATSDPQFVTAHVGLGLGLAASGNNDEAIQEYETAAKLLRMRTPLIEALIANAHGRAGRRDEALKHLAAVKSVAATHYVPAEYLTVAYIGTGDNDNAIRALQQAVDNRSAGVAYINVEPLVDPIRKDPRLKQILAQIRPSRQ